MESEDGRVRVSGRSLLEPVMVHKAPPTNHTGEEQLATMFFALKRSFKVVPVETLMCWSDDDGHNIHPFQNGS